MKQVSHEIALAADKAKVVIEKIASGVDCEVDYILFEQMEEVENLLIVLLQQSKYLEPD